MKNSQETLDKIKEIKDLKEQICTKIVEEELKEARTYKKKEEFLKSIIKEENIYSAQSKEKLIKNYMETPPYIGYCHLYWGTKKEILKEKYNIDWYTPQEENPNVLYD